jgi:hypothetical protein
MGYYTRFDIRITGDAAQSEEELFVEEAKKAGLRVPVKMQKIVEGHLNKWCDIISKKSGYELYEVHEMAHISEAKWYDCEKHMLELSNEYPDVLFEVFTLGEDQDNTELTYFKNGKTEDAKCTITYSPCTL